MKKVTFPLKLNMQSPEVANLQDALKALLEERIILSADETARKEFLAKLQPERVKEAYGQVTSKLVGIFQAERQLEESGSVDEQTAKELNAILQKLGLLDQDDKDLQLAVSGNVLLDSGLQFKGGLVRAFHEADKGSIRLGEDITDTEGRYTIRYQMLPGVESINLRVAVLNADGKTIHKSDLIEGARPLEVVDLVVPSIITSEYHVQGQVASHTSAGIAGLRIRVVDKSVGGDVLLAEAVTDDQGKYETTFTDEELMRHGKTSSDLQAHVFADDKLIGSTQVHYNASKKEILDILLDGQAASALRSEYETLTNAISAHFKGHLKDLKETDEVQDITYLGNKTRWDARAVALASLADLSSANTGEGSGGQPGIDPAFFYALFRAGLPANEDLLYQADPETVRSIWKQAIDHGLIPAALEEKIPEAAEKFQELAAQRALDGPATIGLSPLKDMISVSLGDDAEKQKKFAQIYTQHRRNPANLWEAVRDAFGEIAEKRLRIDGQLAYLTLNNAPLMQKLHRAVGEEGLTDTVALAEKGFYRTEKWKETIGNDPVPPEVPGENDAERFNHYAELLAEHVKLSHPTPVVAEMIRTGETPVAEGLKDRVHAFLTEHRGRFEIGVQPVEQYIKQNNLQTDPGIKDAITRIQRVYQITPSDEAMNVLLNRNLDSAYAVSRYDQLNFVRLFKEDLGGEERARLIHAKAEQLHTAGLNIIVSYLVSRRAPAMGLESSGRIVEPRPKGPKPNAGNVIAYPTLESLLGEMDFCTCEHCRSILSPAAYLVDLLQFLNPPAFEKMNPLEVLLGHDLRLMPNLQATTDMPAKGTSLAVVGEVNGVLHLRIFDSNGLLVVDKDESHFMGHEGEVAELRTIVENLMNTQTPSFADKQRIFNLLTLITGRAFPMGRRPDIQHIPLTCENTNTPLPYIDLVNEILEYYITNSLSLDSYEGHSIEESITPEELMANPQFVSDRAYEILAGKTDHPNDPLSLLPPVLPLPFHQPLESLRRYFDKFESPLPDIMEALRRDDEIERASEEDYGWRDILMEEVRLSRAEYRLLTDSTLTLQQIYGYPQSTPEADVLAELSNAKKFVRRVGIAYEEIVEILKTRFVNPNSSLIPKLERLRITFARLKELKESQETGQDWLDLLVHPLPDASHFGGNIEAWVKDQANYNNIVSLITLADPTGSNDLCSFDNIEFRYANPDISAGGVRAFEFVRLIRFIRLWKKLGWSIEQTDKMMTALYPKDKVPNDPDDVVNLQRLDEGFLVLLPRLGVLLRAMKALNLKPEKGLLPLLACFAPIDTDGASSLYRQMFLGPALRDKDKAFNDDRVGNFLSDSTQKLMEHAEILRSAFFLTDDEMKQIVMELGYDASTPLTLDGISAIYRRGWLARSLKISVLELLHLIRFMGIDPFAPPDPAHPPILQLIGLVEDLRSASLKPIQALYLIWNQDISGRSVPDQGEITGLARTLRRDFAAIESEFSLVNDPDGRIARERIALVYGNEVADRFFGLLSKSIITEIEYVHDQEALSPEILGAASEKIAYDNLRKQLSFTAGVMPDSTRDALKAVSGATEAFKKKVDELYAKTRQFFYRYPELLQLYDAYAASSEAEEKKRFELLAGLLPELKARRKHQQALQAISAATRTDLALADALLATKVGNDYVLHSATDPAFPAIDDFKALEMPGLLVRFFFRDEATGEPDLKVTAEGDLAYAPAGSNKLPVNPMAGNAISGIWSGYLEAPENGFYNIRIESDTGASVNLTLGGISIDGPNSSDGLWVNSRPIELRAGILYPISIKIEKVKDNLKILWETPGHVREVIPGKNLYSEAFVDHMRQVYIRYLKAASFSTALKLTAAEINYLTTHPDYTISGQGWLNSLATAGDPDANTFTALLKALQGTLDFARLKREISPGDERLLSSIKDSGAETEDGNSLLFALTRFEPASLDALLVRFGKINGGKADRDSLRDLSTFVRVSDSYAWVKKLRIPAEALIRSATNEPDASTVRNLQSALRARYEQGDWLKILKTINDQMRELQRDALVAYILHQMRHHPDAKLKIIDTPEKLFEYFLMDVQMESCMQTSRIRHALSSVQLFIERCLMNLEEDVASSSINAGHWEWMDRYRVWEANRKVFLYPENWLEPELRDDQSPFFKEAMSELLQSDITEDSAATALLNYLSKLDEVAKLEPCGIHYVENDPGKVQDDIVHVVARTSGASRSYYYRRLEHGYWTPWDPIKLDIEDNPVIPVVWKGRLFLFWLRIVQDSLMQKRNVPTENITTLSPNKIVSGDLPNVRVKAILCWSEYYNRKWQPTRTSDVNNPTLLGYYPPEGPVAFDRSKLILRVSEVEDQLIIFIEGSGHSKFVLYNTHSMPIRSEDLPFDRPIPHTPGMPMPREPTFLQMSRIMNMDNSVLNIIYRRAGGVLWNVHTPSRSRNVLNFKIMPRIVQPTHDLLNIWDAPFFYEDSRHVFYVTTSERIVKVPKWDLFIPAVVFEGPLSPPPLVQLEPDIRIRTNTMLDPDGPIIKGQGFGAADAFSIKRFVTEDVRISRAIGSSGTVQFGNKEIEPTGSITKRALRQ